jgi:uncharacterized membrane protein
MAVPIFLFVYLGTTVSSVTAIIAGDALLQGRELLISVGALIIVVVTISLIIRVALRVLREELANAGGEH